MDEQEDLGFGVIADSFKYSAEHLNTLEITSRIVQAEMPMMYLYRHACELFLKSSIMLFHYHLEIDFIPHDKQKFVLKNGKNIRTINNTHSLKFLYEYLINIVKTKREELQNRFPNEMWEYIFTIKDEIDFISEYDDKSDYFRYASGKVPSTRDLEKQTVKSVPITNINNIKYERPTINYLIVNSDNEIIKMYKIEENVLKELKEKIIKICNILENFNLQTRYILKRNNEN